MPQTDGLSIAALVLGIVGILISWIPFVGWTLPVLAIVFGFVALARAKTTNAANRKTIAIIAIVLGFVGLVIPFLQLIGAIAYFQIFKQDNFIPERAQPAAANGALQAPAVESVAARHMAIVEIKNVNSIVSRIIVEANVTSSAGQETPIYFLVTISDAAGNARCSYRINPSISLSRWSVGYGQFDLMIGSSGEGRCFLNQAGEYTAIVVMLDQDNRSIARAEKTFSMAGS